MSARSPDRVVLVSIELQDMAHRELEAFKDYALHEFVTPATATATATATAPASAANRKGRGKGKGKGKGVRSQSLEEVGLVQVFGRPLADLVASDSMVAGEELEVPRAVTAMVGFLHRCGTREEGIFRRSGSHARVRGLASRIDAGDLSMAGATAVDVACLLKLYLRSLPEPLLTFELHDAYLDAINLDRAAEKLRALRLIGSLLPKENRAVLAMVLDLFGAIVDGCDDEDGGSKMPSPNLAVVMGLNLFRKQPTLQEDIDAGDDGAGPAVVVEPSCTTSSNVVNANHTSSSSSSINGAWGGASKDAVTNQRKKEKEKKPKKKKKKPLLQRLLGRSGKAADAGGGAEGGKSYGTAAAAAAALRTGAVAFDDGMNPVACTVVELLIDFREHIFTIPADLRDDMLRHHNAVCPARVSAIIWGLITASRVLAPRRAAVQNIERGLSRGGARQQQQQQQQQAPYRQHVGGGGVKGTCGESGAGQAITWIDGAKPIAPLLAAIKASSVPKHASSTYSGVENVGRVGAGSNSGITLGKHHPHQHHPHQHHQLDSQPFMDSPAPSYALHALKRGFNGDAGGSGVAAKQGLRSGAAPSAAVAPSPSAIETVYREHLWRTYGSVGPPRGGTSAAADADAVVALDQPSMMSMSTSMYDPFVNDEGRELGTPV